MCTRAACGRAFRKCGPAHRGAWLCRCPHCTAPGPCLQCLTLTAVLRLPLPCAPIRSPAEQPGAANRILLTLTRRYNATAGRGAGPSLQQPAAKAHQLRWWWGCAGSTAAGLHSRRDGGARWSCRYHLGQGINNSTPRRQAVCAGCVCVCRRCAGVGAEVTVRNVCAGAALVEGTVHAAAATCGRLHDVDMLTCQRAAWRRCVFKCSKL